MPKLHIDLSENKKFSELFSGYNALMEGWNRVNDALHTRDLGWRIRKRRKHLLNLGKELKDLQERYCDHNDKAIRFVVNPEFSIPKDSDQRLTFYLYHSALRDRINQFRSLMELIVVNYNNAHSEITGTRNFGIAITSFAISMIGLVASLLK